MKLIVYPYDFEYKVEDKVYVYSYCKLADGAKIIIKHEHPVFFYASLENVSIENLKERLTGLTVGDGPLPAKVLGWEKIELEFKGKIKQFLKIFVNYPKAVPILAQQIQNWGIDCFEKDILFIHRYLRDTGIIPMTETEVEGEWLKEKSDFPLFKVKKIIPKESNSYVQAASFPIPKAPTVGTNWNILAIDIETYSKHKEIDFQNPILMIALYGKNGGSPFEKVITWKKFTTTDKTIEFAASEKEMLLKTAEYINSFSPEILTGYFSDGFDLPYIQKRCEVNQIRFNAGKGLLIRRSNTTEVKLTGIIHLDILKFIKQIFGLDLRIESFSLDTVAEKLLGSKKHPVDLNKLSPAWDNHVPEDPVQDDINSARQNSGHEKDNHSLFNDSNDGKGNPKSFNNSSKGKDNSQLLNEFCQYNLHDARLTFLLCEKLLSEMIEFSLITGLPLFDVTRMRFGRLVESYILKKTIGKKVIAPNRPGDAEIDNRMDESIQGGFVYEPKPGLYRDLVVFDFRSLYPSIIVSHNIGPESFQCSCCIKNKVPGLEKNWFCSKQQSFLSSLLAELIKRRIEIKKLIKTAGGQEKTVLEAQSYALKILANSFYGYLGFYGARWYSLESAASTTAYARHYIKDTIKKAEENGFTVCYSDTDSCFLLLGAKTVADAHKFMQFINDSLPENMELQYEGYFPRGLFVAIKGSENDAKAPVGAKKKYALLKEDGSLKITGFETVRRNWSYLAKEVQQAVLKMILQDQKEQAFAYVRGVVKDLKKGLVPLEKLVIKTQLTRDITKYKSIGPHAFVAQQMIRNGETVGVGSLIKYIICKGSGLVRERAKFPSDVKEGEYDYNYYINHQLIPAVSSIFAVLGYSEEDIFKESSQKGLGGFI